MNYKYTLDPLAECSVLIRFEEPVSRELSVAISVVTKVIQQELAPWLMNLTPSYNTILVDYLPHRISVFDLCPLLETILNQEHPSSSEQTCNLITLPVWYDPSVGPDLVLYQEKGISLDRVIELHSQKLYTVSAIGFAPGFAFLSDVDQALQLPRLSTPRLVVPKGSVAIADTSTAVYPDHSPGGWNIIGNCPMDLYQPNANPMSPFSVGCQVRFEPIDKNEFVRLGGVIPGDPLQ